MSHTKSAQVVMPSAVPSENEMAAWRGLSEQDRLQRVRKLLASADCATPVDDTMRDLESAAQRALRG